MRNRYDILPCGLAVVYIHGGGQDHATLISADDLPRVMMYPGIWYAQRRAWSWYAAATSQRGGKKTTIRLHRFLTNAPEELQVDHKDHDGLNNTRHNLRVVTSEENRENMREPGTGRDIGYRWYEATIPVNKEPLPY